MAASKRYKVADVRAMLEQSSSENNDSDDDE